MVHVFGRSAVSASSNAVAFARDGLWIPVNALGVAGATLVLLGLPAMYVRMAGASGVLGLLGVVLLAVGWIFLAVFLTLYGLLIAPWLAEKAPSLLAASAPLPTSFMVAFITALVAQFLGTLLLAVPFVRGRVQPRWAGFALPVSAIVAVVGDLIAPNGPVANVALNLVSNLGPVLLVSALGSIGFRTWSETRRPAMGAPHGGS